MRFRMYRGERRLSRVGALSDRVRAGCRGASRADEDESEPALVEGDFRSGRAADAGSAGCVTGRPGSGRRLQPYVCEQGRVRHDHALDAVRGRLRQGVQHGGLFATQLLRITEGQHVSWFAPYVDTEREASAVHDYSIAFIMGMLQTAEYARAVFERGPLLLSVEEIETRVARRVQRREILQREEPARVWVVLHEACLRARIGSPWTMVEQLDHIRAELKRHPTLTVQVLPYESAAGATNIPFTVFENFESSPVVYVEGPQGARPYGADTVVSNAWQSLESLRACALGPHDSDLYIGTVRDEHARQAVGQVQLQRPDRRVRRVGPGSRVRGKRPRSRQ